MAYGDSASRSRKGFIRLTSRPPEEPPTRTPNAEAVLPSHRARTSRLQILRLSTRNKTIWVFRGHGPRLAHPGNHCVV
jgi:hypothetical protein